VFKRHFAGQIFPLGYASVEMTNGGKQLHILSSRLISLRAIQRGKAAAGALSIYYLLLTIYYFSESGAYDMRGCQH
jgi:hypothetical protein